MDAKAYRCRYSMKGGILDIFKIIENKLTNIGKRLE